jgi:phasin family protein
MFSSSKNQFLNATRSLLEMQVDVANKLGMKNVEGFSDLANLNVHAMQTLFNDSTEKMHALVSSKSALEFFSLLATQAQPSARRMLSYGNEFSEIMSSMRDEYFKATQVEVSETGKEMSSILGQIVDHEAGSFRNMVQMTKATVKDAEEEQTQIIHTAEKAVRTPRAAARAHSANHKNSTHHHVAQRKKAAAKSSNGHRKTTH